MFFIIMVISSLSVETSSSKIMSVFGLLCSTIARKVGMQPASRSQRAFWRESDQQKLSLGVVQELKIGNSSLTDEGGRGSRTMFISTLMTWGRHRGWISSKNSNSFPYRITGCQAIRMLLSN